MSRGGLSGVRRYPDAVRAAQACGAHILSSLDAALSQSPRATMAISGGSTPQLMFDFFLHNRKDWDRVHLFWVDERMVPPSDPQSNFKLANDTWLTPGSFPAGNVHRVRTELTPEHAALQYADEIRSFFGVSADRMPQFDVIHRGMGPDAHTASLFPGEPLIDDRSGIAAAVWVEKMKQWRVTLLPGVLESARNTVILATGADKAKALDAVLRGPYDPNRYPAQIGARASRNAVWFVDEAAAALLPKEES